MAIKTPAAKGIDKLQQSKLAPDTMDTPRVQQKPSVISYLFWPHSASLSLDPAARISDKTLSRLTAGHRSHRHGRYLT
jgi:hypothetical protein